ncbi:alpha/beta hydrolase-fold protein [Tenggerimyces flavus]|uniref:Alpha/beta hydrolase-fold protein n=1 Tax=Tenggerimyces flavus TaxID=1708749 RepID=A0ABV7YA76_9ACTN|nr:alpha/beta hydrolase-fold protein [Tenggerimyces flavus]MBM7783639.1 enterochelin esterase family protein [Tenggerimyces flavus]
MDSPRLQALTDADVEAFWKDLETPLVEPIPDDDEHVWLTFLWRATEPVETVTAYGGPAGWDRSELTRLGATDVWYLTYRVRKDLRTTYRLAVNDPPEGTVPFEEQVKGWIPDPLNPKRFVFPPNSDHGEIVCSLVELADAPPPQWTERRDVPPGDVSEHRLQSESLGNERRVSVYLPPGYADSGEPCRLLVAFDGGISPEVMPCATILDNLHATKRIPPTIAVLVSQQDRNVELSCHQPFVDFLADELMPWARERLRISANPRDVIVAGQSLGGLASAFAALRRPDVFGNVLSQSGSFWWHPEGDVELEWLARQAADSPVVPVRFWLEAGMLEVTPAPGLVVTNRHFRTVLHARGYPHVTYSEFSGGHDYACWRESFGDGLIALSG